jgi:hypothetical protein
VWALSLSTLAGLWLALAQLLHPALALFSVLARVLTALGLCTALRKLNGGFGPRFSLLELIKEFNHGK